MEGYLLDTNILNYLYSDRTPQHTAVRNHYMALPSGAPVYISAITLGEIEFGHRCVSDSETLVQHHFNAFVSNCFPLVLPVRGSTRHWYGRLRARLFSEFAPRTQKRPKWPEDLIDPVSARELGIQENDLWLVAQALERDLVFVTNDRMSRIRQVAPQELRVQNWAREHGY